MDISKLKQHLIDNPDYVEEILSQLFYNVKYYDSSKQWYMSWDDEDTSNHIRLRSNTLFYKDYKYNSNGDIFSLLMEKTKSNLGKCLDMVANKSCFIACNYSDKVLPFGGYFKKLSKSLDPELPIYSEKEIEVYPEIISKMFLTDGISIHTQEKFNVRYDSESNRVVIPCYKNGKLIGAIGRYNAFETGEIAKYLPILPYNKSKYIFGWDINYNYCFNKTIILIESEKSVMKAHTLGFRNVLALGGNNISTIQKELIYKLNPEEIIVMFDKGLDRKKLIELNLNLTNGLENAIISRTNNLKSNNCFYSPKISYINLNKYDEIKDGDNIFDYYNIEHEKYIKERVVLNVE